MGIAITVLLDHQTILTWTHIAGFLRTWRTQCGISFRCERFTAWWTFYILVFIHDYYCGLLVVKQTVHQKDSCHLTIYGIYGYGLQWYCEMEIQCLKPFVLFKIAFLCLIVSCLAHFCCYQHSQRLCQSQLSQNRLRHYTRTCRCQSLVEWCIPNLHLDKFMVHPESSMFNTLKYWMTAPGIVALVHMAWAMMLFLP
jgi:hypothetical protein